MVVERLSALGTEVFALLPADKDSAALVATPGDIRGYLVSSPTPRTHVELPSVLPPPRKGLG